MRIWIINHYAVPPSSSGGTRHYSLASHLMQKGHEVVIVAANYNHLTQHFMVPNEETGRLDTSREVPFLWVPVPAYRGNTLARFWNMLVFAFRVQKLQPLTHGPLDVPDVILGSSPHLFAAWVAARLARRLKVPFVLEIRDIWPDTLVELGKFTEKHPLIRLMKTIEKSLYRHARKVITLLPCADRYLMAYGVPAADCVWLPNSVELAWVGKSSPPQNEKFTVMYAGAHGLANDLDTLLSAARLLQYKGLSDKIRICLLGDGPEKTRLKAMAKEHHLDLVEFLDSVPKQEVYALLSKADAFLMLLKKSPVFRWGISPNKLFDYLAMERPVIFGVETPKNPVEEYNAGISVAPSDPTALADAIHSLSTLPVAEREAMGRRGKAYVAEHHDIARLSTLLEETLQEVCRPGHGAVPMQSCQYPAGGTS